MNASNPLTRPGTKRLAVWLAAAIAGTMSAFAAAAPASAVPADGSYHPQCYQVGICLALAPGPAYHFTASTLTYDVGPTPYYISIFDATTGTRLAVCGRGTECTTDQYNWPIPTCHDFVAYVGGLGTSMPPEPVQRTSATLRKCSGAG